MIVPFFNDIFILYHKKLHVYYKKLENKHIIKKRKIPCDHISQE